MRDSKKVRNAKGHVFFIIIFIVILLVLLAYNVNALYNQDEVMFRHFFLKDSSYDFSGTVQRDSIVLSCEVSDGTCTPITTDSREGVVVRKEIFPTNQFMSSDFVDLKVVDDFGTHDITVEFRKLNFGAYIPLSESFNISVEDGSFWEYFVSINGEDKVVGLKVWWFFVFIVVLLSIPSIRQTKKNRNHRRRKMRRRELSLVSLGGICYVI